jgi:two-component system LytT family response regulator
MKAILIDDSKQARELLGLMINELAPEVKIAAEAESVDEAIIEIREYRPELIFLDIEMPGKSGLQLVDQLSKEELNFEIIFTTAYNQYALQAFRLSAIDYLLKPIREKELVDAISKAKQRIEASRSKDRLSVLVNNLSIETRTYFVFR